MNKFAFRTTGILIKALYNLSKAKFHLHGEKNVPEGTAIYVVNHFTRLETFLFPYVLYTLTRKPVWSLAAADLFQGAFGEFLEKVGALSNRAPNRDKLIVKSLLTGDANWIIFPEGRMVKNKKIVDRGKFIISYAGGKHPPHTGAATLSLRTEFYRRRIFKLAGSNHPEAGRLMDLFEIAQIDHISEQPIKIIPVNITYYPLRARENILSKLAVSLVENLPERLIEELMTEGAMLLSGVDIDIRFGPAIDIQSSLDCRCIDRDVCSLESFDFDDHIRSRKTMRREALKVMQAYMSAIYGMTTVNHDHLFASVLRMMPQRRFPEQEFRRRVYLAASSEHKKTPHHRHRSLKEDQISLLTDDRFRKYASFMYMAVEKGFVSRKSDLITKNRSKFSSSLDFNRIRIDNPIAVMANDVEPLIYLQRSLRTVSYMPSWYIRRRVAGFLMKRELADFETAYSRHFTKNSKPRDICAPFLIRGKARDTGILLIHGYLAAPAEVRQLAEFLGRLGYCVYGVRLSGHGTAPEDLSKKEYTDWIRSVDMGYGIVGSLCRRVIVGGFSAGGGLALECAARIPETAGVFAVCPAMRLRNPLSKLAPGLDAFNRSLKKVRMGNLLKTFIEHRPEHPDINYMRNPISGVVQLERLMHSVMDKLPSIHMPALIVQSLGDPLVDPRGSKEAFDNIASTDKKWSTFDMNRHGILRGEGAERVHRSIAGFIAGIDAGGSSIGNQ